MLDESNKQKSSKKSKIDLKALEEQKLKAEKEAFQKIAAATEAGIKAGEEASKKLHADAKVQSEEQTTKAVEKLKTKFDATKKQVMDIVNNFGKIHSDLESLKTEYIQEQQNNLVQIGDNAMTPDENLLTQISSEEKLIQLKSQLQEKQSEITEIVQDFRKMHADLNNIKDHFDQDRENDQQELSMLKNRDEETKLSKMFQKSSQKMHRAHKKRHTVKGNLHKNLKAHFEIWKSPRSQMLTKKIDFAKFQTFEVTGAETKMEKSHGRNWKH